MEFRKPNEDVMCCSPESGFGSENQNSPQELLVEQANAEKCKTSKNLFIDTNEKHDNEIFLKIVDVKSLAKPSSQEKPTTSRLVQQKPKPVKGAKRLQLWRNEGKKILVLNCSLKLSRSDVDSLELDGAVTKTANECVPVRIPFAGLPRVAHRRYVTFDDVQQEKFVFNLMSKQNQRTINAVNTCRIKKEEVTAEVKPCSSKSIENRFDSEACLRITVKKESRPVLKSFSSEIFMLSSDKLHSSSVDSTSVIATNPVHEKKAAVVVKEPEVKLSNKADRIKRLKEILKQKEKNLQEVRKNCGFIS